MSQKAGATGMLSQLVFWEQTIQTGFWEEQTEAAAALGTWEDLGELKQVWMSPKDGKESSNLGKA